MRNNPDAEHLWDECEKLIANEFLLLAKKAGYEKLLDVGSGWGKAVEFFAAGGLSVTAVDNDESISNLDVYNNVPFHIQDGHTLEFEDGAFEAIWSSHALEHFFSPLHALQAWRKLLKPYGLLCLVVPTDGEVYAGHVWDFSDPKRLAYVLWLGGFNRPLITYQQGWSLAMICSPRVDEPAQQDFIVLPKETQNITIVRLPKPCE